MGRKLDSASGPLGVGPPPRYVTVASYVISLEPDGLSTVLLSVESSPDLLALFPQG